MFVVNRTVDRVTQGAGVDENAIVPRTQTKTPHRTPKQRRAFGDISNRKQPGTLDIKARTTPSILKSTTVPTSKKVVSFAATSVCPPTPVTQNESTQPDVEVSAGRVWKDQQLQDDDDEDIRSIQEEIQAWNDEMRAFAQEERTRPLRIRQHRNAMAEKELERRMEAVWGQDDEGKENCALLYRYICVSICLTADALCVCVRACVCIHTTELAAEMQRMLVSVPSFDDLSFDLHDDTFGPYSFPDDISF